MNIKFLINEEKKNKFNIKIYLGFGIKFDRTMVTEKDIDSMFSNTQKISNVFLSIKEALNRLSEPCVYSIIIIGEDDDDGWDGEWDGESGKGSQMIFITLQYGVNVKEKR